MFYDFMCNLTVQKSLARHQTAIGDGAPFKSTVYNGFAEFKLGRVNVSNEFSYDRPSTAVNNKNIDVMRRMIETDKMVPQRWEKEQRETTKTLRRRLKENCWSRMDENWKEQR
ncbi:hypothetical protein EVAR_44040_1 [Eumeta japonica]|uniref:Uncharacterized protein n=1 Tax=Eumeta variegata TaxID=151549 RepID=A0A4C1XL28_EUMVA|nr:hypothetical protein EVAR_44040_1 [Eumeta japonica]